MSERRNKGSYVATLRKMPRNFANDSYSSSDNDEPLDVPVIDYYQEASKLVEANQDLDREVRELQKLIRQKEENHRSQIKLLTAEATEIKDTKKAQDQKLEEELRQLNIKINEIENWFNSQQEIDKEVKQYRGYAKILDKQVEIFCRELSDLSSVIETSRNGAPDSSMLLRKNTGLGECKSPESSAALRKSLSDLRHVIIRRIFSKNDEGCNVQ